jgi:hypothetical protein
MKTPVNGTFSVCPVFHVLDARPGHAALVAEHLIERAVPTHANIAGAVGLRQQLVDEDRLGAELVAAMDDGDRARDIRQIERFFDGGVASADDHDVLALVEEAVAGRARRHALAHERFFRREAKIACRGSRCDDQRVARVFGVVTDQTKRLLAELRRMDVIEDQFGIEALGMLLKARHQVRSLDTVRVGRPVVDIRRRHQLSALRKTGDEHRLQVGARRIHSSGVTGRARTQNQQTQVACRHAFLASKEGGRILLDARAQPGATHR